MKIVRILTAILLALMGAEGLLRILEEPRTEYSGGFRPSIYFEDSAQHVALGPAGYRGFMFVGGERHPVWLALGQDGLRRVPSSQPGAPQVLVVGGASQTFGFGLSDAAIWPSRMAAQWPGAADVRVLALPGTSVEKDWRSAEQGSEAIGRPALIVVVLYKDHTRDDAATGRPVLFRGRIDDDSEIGSAWRQRSYLIDAWAKDIPKIAQALETFRLGHWFVAVGHWLGGRPQAPDTRVSTTDSAQWLRDFVAMAGQRTDPPGQVVVVTLPMPIRRLPRDYYLPLLEGLPTGTATLDLQPTLGTRITTRDLFDDGHYRAPLADKIGAAIGQAICRERPFPACR